jgi:hypothetical protein
MKTWLPVLLCLVTLTYTAAWVFGKKESKEIDHKYDYSINDLRSLYNAKVVHAERFKRPLASSAKSWIAKKLGLKHSGVVVTLGNGQRFLVHKGDKYGNASQTVVVDAKHMDMSTWYSTGWKKTVKYSKVADYVRVGGKNYDLVRDNCHDASRRMMYLN